MASYTSRGASSADSDGDDDFELSSASVGALYKRKDFLGKEEDAKNHPNRTYYFRKNMDVNKLIESCTRILKENPESKKALLIRASSYVKKQQYQLAVDDYSLALSVAPNDVVCLYNRGTCFEKLGLLVETL